MSESSSPLSTRFSSVTGRTASKLPPIEASPRTPFDSPVGAQSPPSSGFVRGRRPAAPVEGVQDLSIRFDGNATIVVSATDRHIGLDDSVLPDIDPVRLASMGYASTPAKPSSARFLDFEKGKN